MKLAFLLPAWLTGLLLPLLLPGLPELFWLVVLLIMAGLLALSAKTRPLAVLLLAMCWALWVHHQQLGERLAPGLEGQRLLVEGRVHGLPEPTTNGWRFQLRDARLVDSGQGLPLLRAHWFAGPPLAHGELWRFEMTLRRPAGMSNPGTFDYEAWLYAQGIGGLASVRSGELLAAADSLDLHGLRTRWRDRLAQQLQARDADTRLLALLVGDRSVLSNADWQVLQATGTSHLMVISGLHVGMLAAAAFALIGLVFRPGWLPWRWPSLWLAAPLAMLVAALYAALAGFAVPTQRAMLMVVLVLLMRLAYRQPGPWQVWWLALAAVLTLDPAAPLRAGFWLSFMAVGLLLLGLGGRLLIKGWWWRWGRSQWVIFIGLWPWLLLWSMPGSLSAPLVNLWAIPWVSVLVVPPGMLGALLVLLGGPDWLLVLAAWSLETLFLCLSWVAQWQSPVNLGFPGWLNWSVGLLACLLLVSPLAPLLRIPALVCLLALAWPATPRPAEGQLWVTVLDVGQGLSVLLQTREHALLYDAGARLPSGFDLGEAVVHPALSRFGLRRLDTLLLSHADSDHAGGALAVTSRMRVDRVLAGEHERLPAELDASACQPGERWEWNGVPFEVLYSAPPPAPPNERSCVLRAGPVGRGVVLPGDLGIRGEYQMLGQPLAAELLLAPHHGSRSSSSYALIRAVAPRWVVFSAGRNNRYNHPHPQVVARYQELQVEPVYTAGSGAVRFAMDEHGSELIWRWREHARRFWHE